MMKTIFYKWDVKTNTLKGGLEEYHPLGIYLKD